MKNRWKVYKNMMKAGLFITLFIIGIQVGNLYVIYKTETGDSSLVNFFGYKKELTWDTRVGPTDDQLNYVDRYNDVTRSVWFSLFFFFMAELFSYKEKPEWHWAHRFMKKKEEVSNDQANN